MKGKGGRISQEKEGFGFREQLIIILDMICVGKKQDNLVERACCFNTDLYYQNPDYLECSYREGHLLV